MTPPIVDMMRFLLEGLTYDEIAYALEGRVSVRTLYRWRSGDSTPQNAAVRGRLRKLYTTQQKKRDLQCQKRETTSSE